MALIVLDGPEKAGKTTVARLIVERWGAKYRHFGAEPEASELYDLTFERALNEDQPWTPGSLVVWDRSWASEVVYGTHFGRTRRLVQDPWLGEWLYGRLARTIGVTAMFLGPSVQALRKLRTTDDHPWDPGLERVAFAEYATNYHWDMLIQLPHDEEQQKAAADYLVGQARLKCAHLSQSSFRAPLFQGKYGSGVLVVGTHQQQLGRALGPEAFLVSWILEKDIPHTIHRYASLDRFGLVVASGERSWEHPSVQAHSNVLRLSHKGPMDTALQLFKEEVSKVLHPTVPTADRSIVAAR